MPGKNQEKIGRKEREKDKTREKETDTEIYLHTLNGFIYGWDGLLVVSSFENDLYTGSV